ncbi:hypothetical protein [Pseudofrankia inefficax]|uniref:hypothetical protein n=1 Tax=Pseudofrankia inefficax (strain DSM 45817 / CECT 9037 / DDB 130130 / EuI1c) TaxID=298654 RepID=UPI0012FE4EB4|nr:hypothetical protein [Pseudofrankia inefficax]
MVALGCVALAGCGTGTGQVVAAGTSQPAATAAAPAGPPKVIYGATVGWWPDGYVVVDDQFQNVRIPVGLATMKPGATGAPPMVWSGYTEQWVGVAGSADLAAVRAADKPYLDGPRYMVDVSRGQVRTIAEIRADAARMKIDETFQDVTVAGHPATLEHITGGQNPAKWALIWTSGADTSVVVNGPDEAVVRRIAENITVGAPPAGPAGPAAATAQVRAAAHTAFQGTTGLGMLDAVDDPEGLARRAVTKYLSEDPKTGATVRLDSVGDIVFLGPTEAGTEATVLIPEKPVGELRSAVRLTRTAGGWKVSRESFCLAMSTVFPGCPTIP